MHPEKLRNVTALNPQDRYGYLIRTLADSEEVWLLQDGGRFSTVGDEDDRIAIPVWPEKAFAELLLSDDWADYTAQPMQVAAFIEWLDHLAEEGISIAGFPVEGQTTEMVSAQEMKQHLLFEMQQYE